MEEGKSDYVAFWSIWQCLWCAWEAYYSEYTVLGKHITVTTVLGKHITVTVVHLGSIYIDYDALGNHITVNMVHLGTPCSSLFESDWKIFWVSLFVGQNFTFEVSHPSSNPKSWQLWYTLPDPIFHAPPGYLMVGPLPSSYLFSTPFWVPLLT